MQSILDTIKKKLGLASDYTSFDEDIITEINNAFFSLYQLGVGPSIPYMIDDEKDSWDDFPIDKHIISAVKEYIYLSVKRNFDPPTTSSVLSSINDRISELEWRLNSEAEYGRD